MRLEEVLDLIDEKIEKLDDERDNLTAQSRYKAVIKLSHQIQALLEIKIKLLGGE